MKIGIPVSSGKTQYNINQAYVTFVTNAGFFPVLITPEMPTDLVAGLIDGLLLPGGIDIDPIYYGEDNNYSFSTDPVKDEFERGLFHAVRETGKPIFGVCRGFQLIIREYLEHDANINAFLEFYQNIPSHNQVAEQSLPRSNYQHFVEYRPTLLYGPSAEVDSTQVDSMPVNSMHHQCLIVNFGRKGVLGARGFRMAAWTDRGLKVKHTKESTPYVCEAFRILKWGSPILAVQWHPEELEDYELISNFFNGVHDEKKEAPTELLKQAGEEGSCPSS